MKKKLLRLIAALGITALGASCSTTYDAYGRPVQTVDAAAAITGIAAAGLIGYALADDDKHRSHRGHRSSTRGYGYGNNYSSGSHYGHNHGTYASAPYRHRGSSSYCR